MVPFQMEAAPDGIEVGDWVFVPDIRRVLDGELAHIAAHVIRDGVVVGALDLHIADMTPKEREIVKAGCLINYNRNRR